MTTFISFKDWLDRNHEEFITIVKICGNCVGAGVTECKCCGSEIDCEECNGTGEVAAENGESVLDLIAAKQAYDKARKQDESRLAMWGK